MADIVTKFEKATGIVAFDEKRSAGFKSRQELIDDFRDNQDAYTMVSYDDRIKFLKDNGYKVTRENLTNVELSAKPPKE